MPTNEGVTAHELMVGLATIGGTLIAISGLLWALVEIRLLECIRDWRCRQVDRRCEREEHEAWMRDLERALIREAQDVHCDRLPQPPSDPMMLTTSRLCAIESQLIADGVRV